MHGFGTSRIANQIQALDSNWVLVGKYYPWTVMSGISPVLILSNLCFTNSRTGMTDEPSLNHRGRVYVGGGGEKVKGWGNIGFPPPHSHNTYHEWLAAPNYQSIHLSLLVRVTICGLYRMESFFLGPAHWNRQKAGRREEGGEKEPPPPPAEGLQGEEGIRKSPIKSIAAGRGKRIWSFSINCSWRLMETLLELTSEGGGERK